MAELVAGIGHQKSLLKVAAITDAEVRRRRGIPRHLRIRADGIEVEAERPNYESDFSAFTIRISPGSESEAERLTKAGKDLGEACELRTENGSVTFVIPPVPGIDVAAARRAVDVLSQQIKLPEVWRFDGSNYRTDPIDLETLFKAMLQYKASDIHITPGQKPIFRVDNQVHVSNLIGVISSAQIYELIKRVAPDRYWAAFEKSQQTSFGYHQAGLGYSRVSAFIKRGAPHITFRYLPEKVPSFEDLHIPTEMMHELAKMHNGLVLIAGMTGSGKTTTVASLVDWINRNRSCHILTIEDPVEYVHEDKKAFVSQRSLGEDVETFAEAVEGALRHDPDVIVVGEMRDADTIRSAISAASTGHLVLSTLHSNNAYGVVNRIVSFFDPVERDLVRQQLVDSLRCVICQKLVPKKGGGRVPALEVLFNDVKAISKAIVAGDTLAIRLGMQQTLSDSMLFEFYLHRMYEEGLIEIDVAKEYAPDLDMLDQILMGTYSVPRMAH
jgi:twitching motility protein PilT